MFEYTQVTIRFSWLKLPKESFQWWLKWIWWHLDISNLISIFKHFNIQTFQTEIHASKPMLDIYTFSPGIRKGLWFDKQALMGKIWNQTKNIWNINISKIHQNAHFIILKTIILWQKLGLMDYFLTKAFLLEIYQLAGFAICATFLVGNRAKWSGGDAIVNGKQIFTFCSRSAQFFLL